MSFSNAEVAAPYSSLMYSYPQEDARLDQDAQNRARQFGAQSAAARGGGGSARGPALNTYNRIASDYTLGKAASDRTNRQKWALSQAAIMRSPGAVTPSTASTLAGVGGTIGASLLKSAAPDIWKKGKEAMGWDQTPQQLSQQYSALSSSPGSMYAPNMGAENAASGQGYGALEASPYASLMGGGGDWAQNAPDFSSAYGVGDAASGALNAGGYTDMDPEVFGNLFNTGFIGW